MYHEKKYSATPSEIIARSTILYLKSFWPDMFWNFKILNLYFNLKVSLEIGTGWKNHCYPKKLSLHRSLLFSPSEGCSISSPTLVGSCPWGQANQPLGFLYLPLSPPVFIFFCFHISNFSHLSHVIPSGFLTLPIILIQSNFYKERRG